MTRKPPELSQALLREALRGAPVIFCAIDADGVITLAEGGGMAALGLKPGDTVGESVFELYKDMPAVRKIVREAAKKDYRFSELVWQVVSSEPFRMRVAPAATQPPTPVVAQAAAE